MGFRLGIQHPNKLKVEEAFYKPWPLCKCGKNLINGVILPCLSTPFCYNCLIERKYQCECQICLKAQDKSVKQLIDIFENIDS